MAPRPRAHGAGSCRQRRRCSRQQSTAATPGGDGFLNRALVVAAPMPLPQAASLARDSFRVDFGDGFARHEAHRLEGEEYLCDIRPGGLDLDEIPPAARAKILEEHIPGLLIESAEHAITAS